MYRFVMATVLSVCLILSVCASAAEDNTQDQSETLNIKTQIVTGLGVINKDDRENLNLDKKLTRGDLAIILYNVMNYGNKEQTPNVTAQIYKDVDEWNPAAGYIEYLSAAGLFSGYEDQTFRPDGEVSLADAYKVILSVAGYRDYAEVKGGYPAGYILVAGEEGLNKEIYVADSEAILRQDFVSILYNALFIQTVYSNSIEAKGIEYKKGKEFLTEIMNLYYDNGIITSVGKSAIDGNAVGDNMVAIDGIVMKNKVENLKMLLGYNVKCFYYDKDDPVLCMAVRQNDNNILTLDNDSIVSYKDKKYIYESNGKKKTAELIQGVDVLYNERGAKGNVKYLPEYGSVTLIDNNNDDNFEVAIIKDYVNIVVNTVNKTQNIIYGKNTNEQGNKYSIDLNSYEQYKIVDGNGENVPIENIKQGNILTAEISDDSRYIYMQMSNKTIDGVISGIEDDEIFINNEKYKKTKYTYNEYWDNTVGVTASLILDINGKIGAITINNEGIWRYAYLINSAEKSGASGCVQVKLLDGDGKIYVLDCENNLLLDNKKTSSQSDILSILTPRQLIRYKNSNKKITAVDTAETLPIGTKPDTQKETSSNNCLLKRVDGFLQYKPVASTFKRYTTETIDGEAVLDDNTVIFMVPSEKDATIEDKDFYVVKKSNIRSDAQVKISAYNTDPDMLKTQAMVIVDSKEDIILETEPLVLVDKVTEAVNANEESSYQISGIMNSNIVTSVLKYADKITVNNHKIKQGDVIRFARDENGEITSLSLIYSDDNKSELNDTNYKLQTANSFDANYRIILGYANKIKDGIIMFNYFDKSFLSEFFNLSGFRIYIYDADGTNNKKVYVGSAGDMMDYETSPSNYDNLIINTRATIPLEIIIIKK